MAEIRFYHLVDRPLERVLPQLLEISLERGWRVAVQAASDDRIEALDAHLWTYRDDSFLPHGTARGADAVDQPVLLVADDRNLNNANVRFLIDGVPIPQDASRYDRLVLIFDGNDDDLVAQARMQWTEAKAAGHQTSYWQPDENGRWVQKA